MSQLRLVHGRSNVREALMDSDELEVFKYQINWPSLAIAMVVGLVLTGLAGHLWWTSPTFGWDRIATFVVLVGGGGGLLATVGYWYRYARTRFVAVSPERFFAGKRDRLWCIEWRLLDRDTVGLDAMEVSERESEFSIDVAEEDIRVRLFNSFVRLEETHELMLVLLDHLDEDEENPSGEDHSRA